MTSRLCDLRVGIAARCRTSVRGPVWPLRAPLCPPDVLPWLAQAVVGKGKLCSSLIGVSRSKDAVLGLVAAVLGLVEVRAMR